MFHANLVLFILIGVLYKKDSLCEKREVWRLCEKCPRTCYSPGIVHCSEECVEGCQCKRRYVRDPLGDCISLSECRIMKYIDNIMHNARHRFRT